MTVITYPPDSDGAGIATANDVDADPAGYKIIYMVIGTCGKYE